MKKLLYLITCILILVLGSCGGIRTSSGGVDNKSFLVFEGKPSNYSGGVDVNIDNQINFKAEVVKEKPYKISRTVYSLSPGKHLLTVSYNGKAT